MNVFVRWLESWFISRRDTANSLFALMTALPVLLVFWIMQLATHFNEKVKNVYRSEWQLPSQIALTLVIVVLAIVLVHCWRNRRDERERPKLTRWISITLLVTIALLGVGYGYKDSPTTLLWLGYLFLCRALFGKAAILPGFIASLVLVLLNEVLMRYKVIPYAVLLNAPIFVAQPLMPWWNIWLRILYNLAALPLSALFFLLFHLLELERRQLKYWVRTDVLTGLTSRGAFMQQFEVECHRHTRSGHSLCLLLCDIDHFKQINDRWGHPAGDEVLAHLGRFMAQSIRASVDVAARFGGEEFAVLLPESDLQQAMQVAEQISTQLRAHKFQTNGHSFHVTLSIGIAQSNDGDGELALRVADDNLYAAKRGGRDRIVGAVVREFAA